MINLKKYSRLNYGCGYDKKNGYLNVDVDQACHPDWLIPAGDLSSLPKSHFDEVLAKDVLEHVPRAKSLEVLLDLASLIKVGGSIIVQTTSITKVAQKFIDNPLFEDQFGWTICLFGNQAHPGDFHYTGFTDTTLTVHLVAAGFKIIDKSMVDDWMMRFECEKIFSWDDFIDEYSESDSKDFLEAAYSRFFYRDLDDIGLIHFGGELALGKSRRTVLRDIISSPERLYVTARKLAV